MSEAAAHLDFILPEPPQQLTHTSYKDECGVHPATSLNTSKVTDAFFSAAEGEGIVLVELFGGLPGQDQEASVL